jgi:adenylate cyclase
LDRRLAAILAADVVGYTRLMGADEAGTLRRLTDLRRDFLEPLIDEHRGRVVKLMGDGLLVEFASVVDALTCALAWQNGVAEQEVTADEDNRLTFRIGINLGDVIVEGDDIHGDGVNIAARLEGLAEPGGVCLSDDAYRQARGKVEAKFEDLGERDLKNVAEPLRVYRIAGDSSGTAPAVSGRTALPLPDKPSIAVLPFANMSGEPQQEYFSDGITEDIITELSRFRGLLVIACNSSFRYKGQSSKVQDIGRELGVHYVVEGSVRKSGRRVRVNVQLVEAESGNHLWAERYDRNVEDIFAVQDEVTQAIAAALPGRLDAAAMEKGRRRPTESLSAYDYLLRGEWFLRRGGPADSEALAMFETATEIDPKSARAHARIAAWHAFSVYSHEAPTDEAFEKVRDYAERALELDDSDAMIHAIAATAYLHLGEHEFTESHMQRAMRLNPNDVEVLYRMGAVAAYCGNPREGLDWLEKAMRLDPFYPESRLEALFDAHYMLADYGKAVEVFRRWRNPPVHMYAEFAAALAKLGDSDASREAVGTYDRVRPKEHGISEFAKRHVRICKLHADRDHWLDGYRKAGFDV